MTNTAAPLTVARYLAARLAQNGVQHLFGLPGDYNLAMLDELLDCGLEWVGSTNELNAAYAADGYARSRGLGALVTTFGVGELSAMNGVAGSYAESVPVVQITGSPATDTVAAAALTHHSLLDGDFDHFSRAYREVTAAAEVLTVVTAARQIDHALRTALDELRPVHLTIPSDVAVATLPGEDVARLSEPLARRVSSAQSLRAFRAALAQQLSGAVRPAVVFGHLARRRDLRAEVLHVASSGVARVATLLDAKGLLDETHPASIGCYIGGFTFDDATLHAVEQSDALVLAGAVLSDLVTGMFTHDLEPAVVLDPHSARVGYAVFADVELADAVAVLGDVLHTMTPASVAAASRPMPAAEAADTDLTQAELWARVEAWLPTDTAVMADAGSAYFGAAGLSLPARSELLGQPAWASIGYTLPAMLGLCVADPSRRHVLIIGDGAAQLTVQEISTILARRLPVLVLLLDNAGYTVERAIRSPEAVYQDVAQWDWIGLVRAFAGGHAVTTATVRTESELASALALADAAAYGPVFVRVVLDRSDAPPLLRSLARGLRGSSAALADTSVRAFVG